MIRAIRLRRFFCACVASVLMVVVPAMPAIDILRRGGATAAPSANPAAGGEAGAGSHAAETQLARQNAQEALARSTMSLQAVRAMQQSARNLAAMGGNNLGANPNSPGNLLPDVPNGLAPGGLHLNYIRSGANLLAPTVDGTGHTTVTFQQTQQQAFLEWHTFNVGRETTLNFDQSAGGASAGQWIVFNRVTDPTGNPTQILGSIQAQGQVYIINQNGIIFGGTSQVNTHALIASSLPINENLIARGLLNNPDSQFLFSALPQDAGTKGPTDGFTPPPPPASGRIGDVIVQRGAQLISPTNAANVGGRVALIGPNVVNDGTISTPDGQTILAAGMQVGFAAHASNDPSLRGLDIYVGQVGSYGGTATNSGLIESHRGSVVITGKNVYQNGVINSSTSVAFNGRVDLLANYNAVPNVNYDPTVPSNGGPFVYPSGTSTGLVQTGEGSLIQILPEWESLTKVVGTELALRSQVNMQGLAVHLGKDSTILAPNADVGVSAGIWNLILSPGITQQKFVRSVGQIYVDQGSIINVAGSAGIAASLYDYILTVDLRAAELADAPLQRNGVLRGQTVTVDLREHGVLNGQEWVGTPLANLMGYLGVIERNAGQLTINGGSVSLQAGESVVLQTGSVIDVSGGYLNFDGGIVNTSRLVGGNRVIDIAHATADQVYDGVYKDVFDALDPRWGQTGSAQLPLGVGSYYREAYSYGGKGGSVDIKAASMALDGTLKGNVVTGPQQRSEAPLRSSLSLTFSAQQMIMTPLEFPDYSPTPPTVEIGLDEILAEADAFTLNGAGSPQALRADRKSRVVLSSSLLTSGGFGKLSVNNSDGAIIIPTGANIEGRIGGSIALSAANLTVNGNVTVRGGELDFRVYNISPYATALLEPLGSTAVLPPADPTRGQFILGAGAQLNVAGLVVDDRLTAANPESLPLAVHRDRLSTIATSTVQGGKINIEAYSADLRAGSSVDVSGGFAVSAKGQVTYGDGGALTVKAGRDPLLTSLLGGTINMGASLSGISGAKGGSLTIQAPAIQVGGSAATASPNALVLDPSFFNQGGFASFHLIGLGSDITPVGATSPVYAPAVTIASGTVIQPIVESYQVTASVSGGDLVRRNLIKSTAYRTPASLTFEAPGVNDFANGLVRVRGDLVMGQGALIQTDPLGSVSLIGQTVQMDGSIVSLGGTVTIKGSGHFPLNGDPTVGYATVHLSDTARISVKGTTLLFDDPLDRRVGQVLAGGTIHVEGNIVADAGAVLDASGASDLIHLLPQDLGLDATTSPTLNAAPSSVLTKVDSNGGSIILQGSEFLFSEASLLGEAGGSTAQGGTLKVQSGKFIENSGDRDDKDLNLVVVQNMSALTQPDFGVDGKVLGKTLAAAGGATIPGMGYFGADSFQSGGFDSLELAGNVDFRGPVQIAARGYLKVGQGGVIAANALTQLSASYVALGRAITPPTRDEVLVNPFLLTRPGVGVSPSVFGPTYGTGRLEVTADRIDIGFLSLQQIGQTSLYARHDLMGSGYFDVAGDLSIIAGQVYPATASTFTITAYDYTSGGTTHQGSITVGSSGVTPQFPLSGGGRLNLYASQITQGGTLRAPLGTINLGWDGSGAAVRGLVSGATVPVSQQITLKSGSVTSVSAIDPNTGLGVLIPYGIVKDGNTWIDPTGFDITSIGAPDKAIRLAGRQLNTEQGSMIDLRGGGELYGYRWLQGNGGTRDVITLNNGFAIMPGYNSLYAPTSPFATGDLGANFGGDQGYTMNGLSVGDQIYFQGANGIAAGVYTLMPARYAMLPGAYLVTPATGAAVSTTVKPGGAIIANGYRFNGLNSSRTLNPVYQRYEVAPQSVIRVRSEYQDYLAGTFLPAAQQRLGLNIQRTASDAGYVLFNALQGMDVQGSLQAAGYGTARGGRVDISSPLDIVIGGPGTVHQPGKLTLDGSLLSTWGAESLLIGGSRTFNGSQATVSVRTNNLVVDNAGSSLTGQEVILVAKEDMEVRSGSSIVQTGTLAVADTLLVSGDGTLVRVSGNEQAQTLRSSVTGSLTPSLTVGTGAWLSGVSLTLDSSQATSVSTDAELHARAVNLSSGQISLMLNSPGALLPTNGLVLGGDALNDLRGSSSLALLSYSSIDLYGIGSLSLDGALALRAGEIRGFNQGAGSVIIEADTLLLDNYSNSNFSSPVAPASGNLTFAAEQIVIGANTLRIDQYNQVSLQAAGGILLQETGGLLVAGNLNTLSPVLTAAKGATQSLKATGIVAMEALANTATVSSGLGAKVEIAGNEVIVNSNIVLPSGLLTLQATQNLTVNGTLNAAGTAQSFFDVVRYTHAGQIQLTSATGNVIIGSAGVVNVSGAAAGGNAGSVMVETPNGILVANGTLLANASSGFKGGSFGMDVSSLPSFSTLNDKLNAGSLNNERLLRVRSGNVEVSGQVNTHRFTLATDTGSILVTGSINATGNTGGRIELISGANLTVDSGALLNVAGANFDNAGKGGVIWLEAGAAVNGVANLAAELNVRSGSTLNLSVASNTAQSPLYGHFTGTLHLRAPQTNGNTEVAGIREIGANIIGASNIVVEGYQIFDLTGSGSITAAVQTNIRNNGTTFTGSTQAIKDRLLATHANAAALKALMVVMPGAEVINRTGNLTLGSETSAVANDWNLATFRYGPQNVAGVLTLRAAGNLEFYNTLSDGFDVALSTSTNALERQWTAPLMALNALAPVNAQHWSYRMAAGADFSAVNFREVMGLNQVAAGAGSLWLGKDAGLAIPISAGANASPGPDALTRLAINPTNGTNANTASNRFQVIRTGTGDIEIVTARDVRLLNQFATIYTAGVTVPAANTVWTSGDFAVPQVTPTATRAPVQGAGLGAVQQLYPAQYSMAGGNVRVSAQSDIIHLTRDSLGNLIADSSRQLPNNWLMRRGHIDPATGQYGSVSIFETALRQLTDPSASTSWWINFSNFFDGVASLGGGNVTLEAGNDVTNVSAHAATNARAPSGTPDASKVLELGGGDVTVRAGRNIDGGVYYVERGEGSLNAGASITTNATRSPSTGYLQGFADILPEQTWLPTTLFVGKSRFNVEARGDVLLGPVANTFLLPQGVNNKHWYKSYFSTYSADSGLQVTSLGGDVTFRNAATLPDATLPISLLTLWMKQELLLHNQSSANYQPWLRLLETDVDPFDSFATLLPASLRATAYSGDIHVVGNMTLTPSATGTLELLAKGGILGLQPTGVSRTILSGNQTTVWSSTSINLSDANPGRIPGVLSPFAYFSVVGNNNTNARVTQSTFLLGYDALFDESGSTVGTYGVTQTKQSLHAPGPLHAGDTSPVRLYASDGDLSGMTLFAGKPAHILAGRDITDIGFYIQNLTADSLSIVASGRDIIAYNPNSALRAQAVAAGNLPAIGETPKSGDIQISGPGTLEVLAGRDLDLGIGSNNPDGTGVGITSIGNGRNPYLPFKGADIVAAAGLGGVAIGLDGSDASFDAFLNVYAQGENATRYLPELAKLLGRTSVDLNDPTLTSEQRAQLALSLFYLVLREAGRDHNNPDSPNAGTYAAGFDAVAKLFPTVGAGSISTQARDIRTKSGGNISLLAPGGGLTLASSVIGQPLAPPGIVTEAGGNVGIFTRDSVNLGISRIFTLRGGDITMWSTLGDIAAGSSSKTVQSAPPTRVIIDPQSADISTDLAGLATGGGIGVLASVAGVAPGNVDLIAPSGTVDAGDAGIRVTGNLNIAATVVLNASNIQAGGSSSGTPAVSTASAPSMGAVAPSAAAATNAASVASTSQAGRQNQQQGGDGDAPSIISVEVLGYGGGGSTEDEELRKKRNKPAAVSSVTQPSGRSVDGI